MQTPGDTYQVAINVMSKYTANGTGRIYITFTVVGMYTCTSTPSVEDACVIGYSVISDGEMNWCTALICIIINYKHQ